MSYETVDRLMRRWWFYLAILFLFFLPLYVEQPYDPRDTAKIIAAALPRALIYSYPALFPLFKILPLLTLAGLAVFGRRAGRFFAAYAGLNLLLIAVFQSAARTADYGLVIMVGNMAVYLFVSLLWLWEAAIGRNDFSPARRPFWRCLAAIPALFAFWFPMREQTPLPDFSPLLLLTNEVGLTGCMMIPVYLAVLIWIHPKVNGPVMRVTAYAGLLTGIMNMLQWFVFQPGGWWLGVLHLPLLLLSTCALFLATCTSGAGSVGLHSLSEPCQEGHDL